MYNTKNKYEQGQALRKEIYMYIVSYIKLVGYAPSITEISERVDAGRATVWKHINQLIDDDLLKTNHPSTDRAYTPVGYGIRKISKEIALSIICIVIIADSIVKLKKVIVMNGTVMNATENLMDGEFPCRKVIELQKKF